MNLNPPYTAVTAKGGVNVTAYTTGLTVVLTLTPNDNSYSPLFSNNLPLTQVGTTTTYTWADYTFQNVPPPSGTSTSYGATITAQAYSDGTTCGSSTSIPIVIKKP
jgi:hypothetical protein